LKSVCAHELSHTWVFENLPAARKKTLSRDAHEGFCELIAYKLMTAQEDEEQKARILKNHYTRGQIQMFIDAEEKYGFNDVVEWMKYGVDSALHPDDLNRIRDVAIPSKELPKAKVSRTYVSKPSETPTSLVLKGITWNESRPLAVINDRTFAVKEMGGIRLGQTNAVIRCLAITKDRVRVQFVGSGEERELILPAE
jgi:hypothetical protein